MQKLETLLKGYDVPMIAGTVCDTPNFINFTPRCAYKHIRQHLFEIYKLHITSTNPLAF